MGFSTSCALTSVPIMNGDAVVMVIFKEDFNPLLTIEEYSDIDVQACVKSVYDDTGIVRPTDDYTVEWLTDKAETSFHIFILQKAWDWAVNTYRPKYVMYGKSNPFAEELNSVFTAFGFAGRNPLAGYRLNLDHDPYTFSQLLKYSQVVDECTVDFISRNPWIGAHPRDDDDEVPERVSMNTAVYLIETMKQKIFEQR